MADYRKRMHALATAIDRLFNEHMEHRDVGFALLVFPFEGPEHRVSYISNADRSDVLLLIKEWMEHLEERQREAEGAPQSNGDSSR